MEYVDGEDLASLLRRIGKLPQEKALEIARQLCAGLAAAHDNGVIHRDLKPANIMLDGKGHVRITDFGIAGVAAQIRDVRSGTPAYMSPQQLTGKEVTARSDIYALGIVLCELLTGKRPPLQPADPGATALDPAIERVIQRCLDPDPEMRPPSALAVSAALPGGDPLAAALARGETPSPEAVAASQQQEGLTRRSAGSCFAAVMVLLALFAICSDWASILHRAPLDRPAEVLAFRAQQVLRELGYRDEAVNAYGFDQSGWPYIAYLNKHSSAAPAGVLATHRPAVITFWYRQSPVSFQAISFPTPAVDYDSPRLEPGMVRLRLDAKGRLIALDAWPSPRRGASDLVNQENMRDPWSALFRLAELDPARFVPAEPTIMPGSPFDLRSAWTGTFEAGRTEFVRVEAASGAGKPVYFSISGEWQTQPAPSVGPYSVSVGVGLSACALLVVVGSVVLAVWNLRRGRADRYGAWAIAAAAFGLMLACGVFGASHVANFWEMQILARLLSWSCFVAALLAALYLAIEPYVRRHWPNALISWSRFRAGRIRDPLVASHLLIGITTVLAFEVTQWALLAAGNRTIRTWQPIPALLEPLNGYGRFVAELCAEVAAGFFTSIALVLLVVLMRIFIKRLWLADLLVAGLISIGVLLSYINPWQSAIAGAMNIALTYTILWMLRRFGLLSALAAIVTNQILTETGPVALSSWYAGRSLVILAMPAAVAAWSLWVVLSAYRRERRQWAI
jgi:serine/threonine-protein kinase